MKSNHSDPQRSISSDLPLLSVIVPVYNVEAYLRDCIDSILTQSYPRLEILIVDDGSSDTSPQICDTYAAQDPRIKVYHTTNGGLSAARNYGLERMRGDYVTFIDSDDWLEGDILSTCMQYIGTHPETDFLQFGMQEYWQDEGVGRVTTPTFRSENLEEILRDYALKREIQHCACAKIYRARLFDELRFPVRKYHEDIATVFDTLCLSRSVASLPQAGYMYRQKRPGSITEHFSEKRLDIFDNIQASIDRGVNTPTDRAIYLNTIRVMYLRFYCIEAWENDPQRRSYWLQQFRPHLKRARSMDYIWGNRTERLHWAAFLAMPRLYLSLWSSYMRNK